MRGGASRSNPVRSDSGNEITRHHRQLYNNRYHTQIRIQKGQNRFDHIRRFTTGILLQSHGIEMALTVYLNTCKPTKRPPALGFLQHHTSAPPLAPPGTRWSHPGRQAVLH